MTAVEERALAGATGATSTRRWLSVLAIVAAVLVVADLAAQVVQPHLTSPQTWPTPELQHKFGLVQKLAGGHRTKVVMFGDSLMDAGLDPASFGARPGYVFNAALAGETLGVISPWATEVVIPRLHPDLVVIGFSVNVLNADIPGNKALIANYADSRTVRYVEGKGDLVDDLNWWFQQHVALYRDRSVLRHPFSGAAAASIYDPPLSSDGWNEDFAGRHLKTGPAATAAAVATIRADLLQDYRVGQDRIDALGRLIDRLRGEGSRVLLVAMPVSPDYVAAVPGGSPLYQAALGQLLATGAAHGASTASVGVWPAADFADAGHLNRTGTLRLTAWLSSETSRLTGAHP